MNDRETKEVEIQNSSEENKKPPVSSGMRQLLDFNAKLRATVRSLEADQQAQIAAFEKQLQETRLSHQAELAELSQEQEKRAQMALVLEGVEAELASAKGQIESLQAEVRGLQATAVENGQLKAQLEQLRSELEREKTAKESAITECEALRQEGTLERCRLLEEENNKMKALVERRDREISAALKSKEQAEQVAFESRNKLLTLYSEQESSEILKANLQKAQAEVETQSQEILRLQAALKEAEDQRVEMEEKILYSSKRDNLRDSLSTMAKRRKTEDL